MSRVRFGAFEADLSSGELWRDGTPVPLQDLPFRLLAALLERPGDVVTRAELTARLWGSETFVDAVAGLNTAVAKLREALGDSAESPAFIETIPKRGYRFVAQVDEVSARRPTQTASVPADASNVERRQAQGERVARMRYATVAIALVATAIVAITAYKLTAGQPQVRVAVVLFDNETRRDDLNRLAQGLTDATVFELTAQPRLAVIGNAAVLRTTRPFRDLVAIRDAVQADFIVIGQVQAVDDTVLVRTHLIRAQDQAHVWVEATRMAGRSEADLQSDVAARVATAVTTHAQKR